MDASTKTNRFGIAWRLGALVLAGILVFHLASPAASNIARRNEETLPQPTVETAAAMTVADYLSQAEQSIQAQAYDQAYSQLSQALELTDEHSDGILIADILVKMVSIQILQQKYEQAVESIEQIQKSQILPQDDSLGGILEFLQGGCYLQLGAYGEALAAFRLAMELGYDQALCMEQIILCCFELGEYETVSDVGETLLSMENVQLSDPVLVYQRLGTSQVYLGVFDKGLELLEKSNEVSGDPDANGYYRGICLLSLGRNEKAVDAFTASIEEEQLLSYCYYNRGVCYLNLKDYKLAKADMEKALELGGEPDMLDAAQKVLRQLT